MEDEIKRAPGQTARLEHFVETLQEQDDTVFLMRRIVRWMGLLTSVFVCSIPFGSSQDKGLELSTVSAGMNAFFMGMLFMVYTLDFPVAMRRNAFYNLYETLRYFPVDRLEIYAFLKKRLLRYLGLYGGLAVSSRLIVGVMTDSLGMGSLIFPLVVWLLVAFVGFAVIRVRMAWRMRAARHTGKKMV